jgi:hypothetical protein
MTTGGEKRLQESLGVLSKKSKVKRKKYEVRSKNLLKVVFCLVENVCFVKRK